MESIAVEEHFMCTDVEWDGTGRQVATWVSAWKHQVPCPLFSSLRPRVRVCVCARILCIGLA